MAEDALGSHLEAGPGAGAAAGTEGSPQRGLTAATSKEQLTCAP